MLAIRDDDTSFWTKPEELENIYGKFLKKGGKLSLAVVPCSYHLVCPGDRRKFYISDEKKPVYENKDLVYYLRPYVENGQIEIMLHGYDHSYCIQKDGQSKILNKKTREEVGETNNLIFLPECIYKDDAKFKNELIEGKKILESTFKIKIKTFVPPSNAIRADVVEQISDMGLNISGTILPSFNRKLSRQSLICYLKKMFWRIYKRNYTYPWVLDYGNHKELCAHTFAPSTDFEREKKDLNYCIKNGYNYVVATHYWEIKEGTRLLSEMQELLIDADDNNTSLLKNLF